MRPDTLVEEPGGVAIYRRVLVGYMPRGSNGLAMCLWCQQREVGWKGRQFCNDTCMNAHKRSLRKQPKARWQPCPGCGLPCIKCARSSHLRCWLWKWKGRTPVWKSSGEPVHGGQP